MNRQYFRRSAEAVSGSLHALGLDRASEPGHRVGQGAVGKGPLLTGDRKLFDAIKVGPLSPHIAWIGDLNG